MDKLYIYFRQGLNNINNSIPVNLMGESNHEEIRKVILTVEDTLKKKFPGTEVSIRGKAKKFL